jgi:hypothetical protein
MVLTPHPRLTHRQVWFGVAFYDRRSKNECVGKNAVDMPTSENQDASHKR